MGMKTKRKLDTAEGTPPQKKGKKDVKNFQKKDGNPQKKGFKTSPKKDSDTSPLKTQKKDMKPKGLKTTPNKGNKPNQKEAKKTFSKKDKPSGIEAGDKAKGKAKPFKKNIGLKGDGEGSGSPKKLKTETNSKSELQKESPNQNKFKKDKKPGFNKSGDKPAFKSGAKPAFKSGDKPGFKSVAKPAFKSGNKPGFKSGDKPGLKSGDKPGFKPGGKPGFKQFSKFGKDGKKDFNKQAPVEPTDWVEFKKKKKELRAKRKQGKVLYDSMTLPKKLGEQIRRKNLPEEERNKLIEKVHGEVKGKGLYAKFVLTHDMTRIIQILLKFGSQKIREEIAQELTPMTVQMLESKYGKFCVKRMLKYGTSAIRSEIIKSLYSHAVKLSSHVVSAAIFEYAYSTWATPLQKIHLVQEFFGDIYKQSKDDNLKHLRDVFKDSPDMKAAALSATKANLSRILNKDLLDSGLVQTVLYQFLSECSEQDKQELISQLAPHVVILSNSKDGARVVMICIWHGSNKDRKVAMKALKEHVVELSKHEHGHTTIITLLDSADDTVLVNKMIIGEILNNALDLAKDEWGRKVLIWLISPADTHHFHPHFIKELDVGRTSSTSKKAVDIRRKEIHAYSSEKLLKAISASPSDWMASGAIATATLSILKAGCGQVLKDTFQNLCDLISDSDWKIKENDAEVVGIENAGLHMILKKLAQHDKVLIEKGEATFGEVLVEKLEDSTISQWITTNRGCFLLVAIIENGSETAQNNLKSKLASHKKLIKSHTSQGAKILLKKLS